MEQGSRAVEGPLDATVVPLEPKRVTYAFTSGLADWLKPAAEGRRLWAVRVDGRGAMSGKEPGISDGAHVACARFSLPPRGACGSGVDPPTAADVAGEILRGPRAAQRAGERMTTAQPLAADDPARPAVGIPLDRRVGRRLDGLPRPYYEDGAVTLYHGDALELLPLLPRADAVITDPPYGETSLDWDVWPDGWPDVAALVAPQMWCFGSMRMFLDKRADLAGWKLAQDVVWEKHNGSNNANDRFRRLHELALHFYRGEWGDLFKAPQLTNNATARTVHRKARPAHWGDIGAGSYASEDGGPKLMGSVIYARSCHGYAVNETQKPEDIVAPLLQYSVPPGGLVVDCFAGSGTTGAVARKTGRRAILIEKRESQCQAIAARLAQGDLLTANEKGKRTPEARSAVGGPLDPPVVPPVNEGTNTNL